MADIILSIAFLGLALIPMLIIALIIKATSPGPILYWSDRVGVDNRLFRMAKFRTMKVDTPVVATHLLQDPAAYLMPIGSFLRKTSLDELPQLLGVIKGDLSLVGPRPALFNQYDLIELRTEAGVHQILPGITGWAQINGRDTLPIPQKVKLDTEYLDKKSLAFDLKILFLTALQVVKTEGVSH